VQSGRLVDHLTFGRWRRQRRMLRLLRELDRIDDGRRPYPGRARELGRRLVAGLLAVALVSVIGFAFAYKQFGITVSADGVHRRTPLARPPEVTTGMGSYEFLMHQPMDRSRPVAYDPCRPIELEVNEELAPAGAASLVHDAVARVEAATGLDFRYRGTTDRLPAPGGPALGGRRPAIIAWTTPAVVPTLAGRVAGVGGSQAEQDSYTQELRYVTGMVALDAPQLREVMDRPDGAAQVEAIVLHELGHLVGLAHVDDPDELMHDDNVGLRELGPGDREGLAALGSGRCYQ
jgi:hypothetical protein